MAQQVMLSQILQKYLYYCIVKVAIMIFEYIDNSRCRYQCIPAIVITISE